LNGQRSQFNADTPVRQQGHLVSPSGFTICFHYLLSLSAFTILQLDSAVIHEHRCDS
jgi:hypothetical protein